MELGGGIYGKSSNGRIFLCSMETGNTAFMSDPLSVSVWVGNTETVTAFYRQCGKDFSSCFQWRTMQKISR